jgi:hypothetical protein
MFLQSKTERAWTSAAVLARIARIGAALIASVILSSGAFAQLPCSYEVAAVIQAPSSPPFTSPTIATAISPNGRYVVGWFTANGFGFDRAFSFDMQTQQFRILPLITGTYTSYANDVNDAGIVVGMIGGTAGDWGYLFNLATSQYTLLPPIDPAGSCEATGIKFKQSGVRRAVDRIEG